MKLHGYFRSAASWQVRIALNLKGLPYKTIAHHLRRGEQRAPAYLAINPQGLVPALELGDGVVLTQSLAIIEWQEETPPLLPLDPIGRAHVRAFALALAADTHPLQNLRVLNHLRERGFDETAARQWAGDVNAHGLAACEALLPRSSAAFCFGQTPGLADVCLVRRSGDGRRRALRREARFGRRRPRLAGADPDAGAAHAEGHRRGAGTDLPRPRRGVRRGRRAHRRGGVARGALRMRRRRGRQSQQSGRRVAGRVDLLDLCARLAARGGWLVVDEAFADFDPEEKSCGLPAREGRGRPALVRQGVWAGGAQARLRHRFVGRRRAAARRPRPLAGQRAGDRDRRARSTIQTGFRRWAQGSTRTRRGSTRCWSSAAGASSAEPASSAWPARRTRKKPSAACSRAAFFFGPNLLARFTPFLGLENSRRTANGTGEVQQSANGLLDAGYQWIFWPYQSNAEQKPMGSFDKHIYTLIPHKCWRTDILADE